MLGTHRPVCEPNSPAHLLLKTFSFFFVKKSKEGGLKMEERLVADRRNWEAAQEAMYKKSGLAWTVNAKLFQIKV